jgi:hypothetical protein
MSDSNSPGSGAQPKTWTPITPPAAQAPASGPGLLVRIALGVVGLVVVAFGIMQMGQGMGMITGGGASSAGLVHKSFDPANPPPLGDPGPAIAAHLQRVAGDEPLRDDARQAIDLMVSQTRAGLPLQLDEVTSMVGISSYGRHIVFDNRVMMNARIDNIAAWRENAVKQLTPSISGKVCAPGNAHIAQFTQQYDVTLWHAYTLNDGNPPLFIKIPPQKCGG